MLQQPEGVLVEKAHSSILCPKKGREIVFFFHPAHPLLPAYLLGLSNYWNVFLCQPDQAMEAHYNCDAFRSFPWVRVGRGGFMLLASTSLKLIWRTFSPAVIATLLNMMRLEDLTLYFCSCLDYYGVLWGYLQLLRVLSALRKHACYWNLKQVGVTYVEKQVGGFGHRWFVEEDPLTLLRRKTIGIAQSQSAVDKSWGWNGTWFCEVIRNFCDNKMGC